ncbi:hypothetical protein TNCT_484341 [Trichonephila clavata]|uniref:Uncharacterized protein n=1 Tax=Trichonephila clavata TaxID=2740835 RepID=A0A8X6GER7_TRICU|nr:hypothetical protein TNCT_484341 [Trichonephila clavata]
MSYQPKSDEISPSTKEFARGTFFPLSERPPECQLQVTLSIIRHLRRLFQEFEKPSQRYWIDCLERDKQRPLEICHRRSYQLFF